MAQTTIAIVADCDDTLAPDTTGQLLELCGVDSKDFFTNRSNPLVREGWDPSLAYMHEMIRLAENEGPLASLTQERIREVAQLLKFYPGVPDCFASIKDEVEKHPDFRDAGIHVETYVISGGITELLRASVLADATHYIWGCDFAYDSGGRIAFAKNVISFTDKTRFLYMIQKGLVGSAFEGRPFEVNRPMTPAERRVPFENMIYVGDGPSDVPCMSLLQSHGGHVIGILSDNPAKTYALGFGRRVHTTVPHDFRPEEYAYRYLREAVWERAQAIAEQASATGLVPRH